jgi:hypothetical protein
MRLSDNTRVQTFLDEMLVFDGQKYEILQRLRDVVFAANPKVTERMMYGGIMFSLGDDFGGIFAYKNHVSFEFGAGTTLQDPKQILEGKGKSRRHLKIASYAEIEQKDLDNFVQQTIAQA